MPVLHYIIISIILILISNCIKSKKIVMPNDYIETPERPEGLREINFNSMYLSDSQRFFAWLICRKTSNMSLVAEAQSFILN